ncbi:MAG: hypothetical protein LUE08_00040, partial [Akkermansiaceae bacterium]|nr:hypothetical protein [Akkermansiaceae bacterium]
MSKKVEKVELEMVPLPKPATTTEEYLEQTADNPAYQEQVKNGTLPMYSPGGGDNEEAIFNPEYYGKEYIDLDASTPEGVVRRLTDKKQLLSKDFNPDDVFNHFYTQKREIDVAQGFSALAIGWDGENAEENQQLRQIAVNAFGEPWVQGFEKQDKVTQGKIAGKRYLTEYYTLPGDKDYMPLMRYNDSNKEALDQDASLYATDEFSLWHEVQKKEKAKHAEEVAKRKEAVKAAAADGEKLDSLVYDYINSTKDELTAEDAGLLSRCGIPRASLDRARNAFRHGYHKWFSINHAVRDLEGDELARQLMLQTIRRRAAVTARTDESEYTLLNIGASAWSAARNFAEETVRGVPDWIPFLQSREYEELQGDITNAIKAGREDYRKETGFRASRLAGSVTETGLFVGQFALTGGGMAVARILKTLPIVLSMWSRNTGSVASAARAVPMDKETFAQIAKEHGLEEAYRRKAEQERVVSRWAIRGQAAVYTGAEFAAFKYAPRALWGGAARAFGVRQASSKLGKAVTLWGGQQIRRPAAGRGMMAGRAMVADAVARFGGTRAGAVVTQIGRTTADFGVVIPGATGLLEAAYDATAGDPKMARGMEELGALWQEIFKPEYWGETAVSGVLFGAVGGHAARRRMDEQYDKVGRVMGLTDEQRQEVKKLNPVDRGKKIGELNRYNWEHDGPATAVRANKAAREELDKQRAREMREDEIVMTALSEYGYSIEPSEEPGQYWLYEGGTIDMATGKFTRGEKKYKMSEDDIDRFVDNVMGSELRKGARVLKEAVAMGRTLDAAAKELAGKVIISYTPTMESFGQIRVLGEKAAKRVEKRAKEIMDSEEGVTREEAEKRAREEIHEDIDKDLTLGETIDRGKSAKIRDEQERAQRVEDEITRLKQEN